MSEKQKKPEETPDEDFPTLKDMCVSSATDLTGLMYRPPVTEDELDSYQDLYDMEYSDIDDGI